MDDSGGPALFFETSIITIVANPKTKTYSSMFQPEKNAEMQQAICNNPSPSTDHKLDSITVDRQPGRDLMG